VPTRSSNDGLFVAVHESGFGTTQTFRHVRDDVCSQELSGRVTDMRRKVVPDPSPGEPIVC